MAVQTERPRLEQGPRVGEYRLRRCTACGHVRAPEHATCTACISESDEWFAAASGTVTEKTEPRPDVERSVTL